MSKKDTIAKAADVTEAVADVLPPKVSRWAKLGALVTQIVLKRATVEPQYGKKGGKK